MEDENRNICRQYPKCFASTSGSIVNYFPSHSICWRSHNTYMTLSVSELCMDLGIICMTLYPNSTRILQPAHVAAFRPLKIGWRKVVFQWRRDNPTEPLTKINFVLILKLSIESTINSKTIRNGFRATGLCPWNPQKIRTTQDV